MFTFQPIDSTDKSRFYRELETEITGLLESSWIANLSNVSASLMAHMPDLNWAGFYLVHKNEEAGGKEELVLGPFQGLPACLRIAFDRGVCGAAARTRQTVLVDDVHAFPGHIACDARSRSEVVVPILVGGRLIGVLDLDSPKIARFTKEDREGLERIVKTLADQTTWPAKFL